MMQIYIYHLPINISTTFAALNTNTNDLSLIKYINMFIFFSLKTVKILINALKDRILFKRK